MTIKPCLPQSEEMANAAGQNLNTVLDALPIPVCGARLEDAKIVFMNRKFQQAYGYTLKDFEDIPHWFHKACPNLSQRESAENNWLPFFGKHTEHEFEIEPVELDVLCKNGAIKTTIHEGSILPEAGLALATYVDISDRKRNELINKYLSEQDQLTGLPNRRSLDLFLSHAVSTALKNEQNLHLLLADLDNFKEVNDSYGHQAGDEVLKITASHIKKTARAGDFVARFGGDEFVVILEDSHTNDDLPRLCEDLLTAINKPHKINDKHVNIRMSIGVSGIPGDASNAHDLFAHADKALYRAKRSGRNLWRQYSKGEKVEPSA